MAKGNSSRKPVHPWVERAARFGYAIKGVVYITVGALAVMAALGAGGQTTDTRGAFREIYSQPFGQVLLGIVAVGLVAYAVWRVTQAIVDAEGKGDQLKGISIRIGYACSGLIHAGLAFSAARVVLGDRQGSSEQEHKSQTAQVMALPFGPLLVGLVGVGFIGFGLYQIYKGYKRKFLKRLEGGAMNATENRWAIRCGQIGLAARGVVFGIIGYFLIMSAFHYDPREVRGLGGALRAIAVQPHGKILLGIVAAGLAVYGFYMFIEAKYHNIRARS
ncbi:MAG TPA: DUF1206 domain-containing protein [Blastocatellia bacterium]|jgi:hypothetical protein|nr:DUF1206 domain-containing protein [Blastocatellia bacterium]